MAAGPSVGAQLNDMMNALSRYEQTASSTEPQSKDLSFMTLLWPLLPLLPPEPPLLVSEMLKRPDKCDLCGTSQGRPLRTRVPKSGRESADTSSHIRSIRDKTSLDRLMMDVEKKLEETLDSLQETVEKNAELSSKAKEMEKLRTNEMSDAELLKTLKRLTKEKAEKMEKVNILEVKEQQLKESLTTAIGWAKSVELRKGVQNDETVRNLRQSIERNVALGDTTLENIDHEKTIPEKGYVEGVVTEKAGSEEIMAEIENIRGTTTEEEDARENVIDNEVGDDINTEKEHDLNEMRRIRARGM